MDEVKFRKKFERQEGDKLGKNTEAVNKVVHAIKSMENSNNASIKYFADSFDNIDVLFENLSIFEADRSGFYTLLSTLNISKDSSDMVVAHELGHILNNGKNFKMVDPTKSLKTVIVTPNECEEIFARAKANCLTDENKQEFKEYFEYLCKGESRTESEIGPISDIFSAVFKTPGLCIGTKENQCMLPSIHTDFFLQDISEEKRIQVRYDEVFANIFALKALNNETDLKKLEKLFGNEFMKMYDNEIEQCLQVFREKNINEQQKNKEDDSFEILPRTVLKFALQSGISTSQVKNAQIKEEIVTQDKEREE